MLRREVKLGERIDFEYNGDRVGYMIVESIVRRGAVCVIAFDTDLELRVWHNVRGGKRKDTDCGATNED